MSENTNERLNRYAEAVGAALYDACQACHGQGWTVENRTWSTPEGEQVQCERCGYLNAGLNPVPGAEVEARNFVAHAVMAVADAEQAELRAEVERLQKDRDTAQEHVAYHLQDYSLNGEATGDLAVDMADYSGRLRIRAEAAEAELDRARSLAATLEARLAQEQAKVARVQEVVIEHWPEIPGDALMAALEGDA